MAVFPPGFSERVFEFSFNAEYAAANKAVLAGAPHIPTQNDEKYLGYDVLFEIQAGGGVTNVLALQHKTVRLVTTQSGTNAHFCAEAGVPYFAFRIDVEQFNVIQSIAAAGLPGIEFYYCVPVFTTRKDMDTHYMAQSVTSNSLWIDVAAIGALDPSHSHTIVYDQRAVSAWIFSDEPRKLKVIKPRAERAQNARNDPLSHKELRKIYDVVFNHVKEYWSKPRDPRVKADGETFVRPDAPPTYAIPDVLPIVDASSDSQVEVMAIRDLLCSYVGMSLLVELPS